MNKFQKSILALILFPFALNAQQKEGELNNDITVVKGYKPILAEARKISDSPTADTASFEVPKLTYNIDPKPLPSAYNISPIKAVKIKDENIKKLYRGYFEGGYGLQNTFYGDLYYNALRSKDFNAGIHLKHLSSTGKITDYGFPGNSLNLVEANGKKFLDHSSMGAQLAYQRNMYHYYGYDAESTIISKKDIEHLFNDLSGKIEYESLYANHDELEHKFGFDFYNISDNHDIKESRFGLNAMLGKNFYEGYLHGDLNFAYTKFTEPIREFNRSLISIAPKYDFDMEPWKFSVGFNFQVESEAETKAHLYPFARFDYTLAEKSVIVYGELNGKIQNRNFRESSRENPFLYDTIYFANTNQLHNVKFGTNIRIDNDFHFNAYVNFASLKDELFYVNNYSGIYPVTFSPVYSDATLNTVHGELGYEHNTKLNLWFKADYFGYSKLDSAVEKPWHVSPFVFTLSLNYNISDKIIIKTDWFIHSSSNYKIYESSMGSGKLKSWGDINLSAEYRYTKALSFFLNLNNIGFSKYQQWYNYPTYRFSALAGLTYSFQ
ncbi:MAG: hypothetical protein ABI723_03845 [Bacteroidia bacterium]